MVSGAPDKPHLQLPFQPVDHQAGGQLGERLQRALENLRKQHKWGDISDEEYRTERESLVRQVFQRITIDGKDFVDIEPKPEYAPLFATMMTGQKVGYQEFDSPPSPPFPK